MHVKPVGLAGVDAFVVEVPAGLHLHLQLPRQRGGLLLEAVDLHRRGVPDLHPQLLVLLVVFPLDLF